MKDITIVIFCFCAVGRGVAVDGARGNTRFFWQVSDFHYDASYSSSHGDPTKMCHQVSGLNYTQLGEFGNYLCDAPWELVVSAMQAMKDFYPDPDFILWTGKVMLKDKNMRLVTIIPEALHINSTIEKRWNRSRLQGSKVTSDSIPHIKDTDINLQKVYINIGNVTDELRKTFPNTSIYPVLGNHDSYPSNEMPYDILVSNYYRQILTTSHWDSLLDNDCQKQFQKGGYFSISPRSGLRIIALNTNLYSTLNTLTDHLVDPADQFQWLDRQLDDAKKNKENVFLVAHIPPGLFEKIPSFPWFYEDYNKRYLDLLQKHADIITAQFFAHEHTDSFRLLYDSSTGKPVGYLLLSPSVTPWMSTIPGVGANNPSIRLFEYDLETGIIQRYQQFYLNLTAANIDGNATWLKEYDTKEDYALDKITAHEMQQLVDSFYDSRNGIFQKYLVFNSVSKEMAPACNSSCFHENICAITKLDLDEYDSCIAGSTSTSNPSSTYDPDSTTKKHHDHDNNFPKLMYYVIGTIAIVIFIIFLIIGFLCISRRRKVVPPRYAKFGSLSVN